MSITVNQFGAWPKRVMRHPNERGVPNFSICLRSEDGAEVTLFVTREEVNAIARFFTDISVNGHLMEQNSSIRSGKPIRQHLAEREALARGLGDA